MVYGARKPPATGLRNPPTPSMSPPPCAPVAQLDRASDYESEGRAFESLRARQCKPRQVNDLPGFMFFGRECSLSGTQPPRAPRSRSEEHTSELQSLMRISYAVFCLKKKKQQQYIHIKTNTQH